MGGEMFAVRHVADPFRRWVARWHGVHSQPRLPPPAAAENLLRMIQDDFNELQSRKFAAELRARYSDLEDGEKIEILEIIAQQSDPERILTRFNDGPHGIKFLIDLRADVLNRLKSKPNLKALELCLKTLLSKWFDVGFLQFSQITWDSPASLLEKLIQYESVHPIHSWTDLKNRLDCDRRCFAYFHSSMPHEPLIFIEVALTTGLSKDVQSLLDEKATAEPVEKFDTAIFYSISNCQMGLAGIAFGNFLIKRVVEYFSAELPHIKQFATLSPIPGFRHWLSANLESVAKAGTEDLATFDDRTKNLVMDACAQYLTTLSPDARRALNPVAHFHLSNGAKVERINWQSDISASGIKQSLGLMVNYKYELSEIEKNMKAYIQNAEFAISGDVSRRRQRALHRQSS